MKSPVHPIPDHATEAWHRPETRTTAIHTDLVMAHFKLTSAPVVTPDVLKDALGHLLRAIKHFEDAFPEVGSSELTTAGPFAAHHLPLFPSVRTRAASHDDSEE